MSRLSSPAVCAALTLLFAPSCNKKADMAAERSSVPSGTAAAAGDSPASGGMPSAAPADPGAGADMSAAPASPATTAPAKSAPGPGLATAAGKRRASDGEAGGGESAAVTSERPPVDDDLSRVEQRGAQPGLLTAGDWDDNLNFDFFRAYLAGVRAERPDLPGLQLDERVTIRVTDQSGAPVRHATVSVRSGERVCLTAPTGADGRLLFFPSHDCGQGGGRLTVSAARSEQGARVSLQAPRGDTWTVTLPGAAATQARALDMALLIDATGSMGDEIAYLQEEVRGIVEGVRAAAPGISVRFALIVYRDTGDEYVTRVFQFTDDLEAFRRSLSAQSAGGGGDYPEALDQGIAALNQLAWRTGDVSRVAFVIADAPPHTDRASAYLSGVDQLRRRGVHIYPVGASGVADEAEYLFRVTAALTQSRYLFLTDDSGIGGSHAEPHIPCYQVQRLDDLLRRMVVFELTGESPAPRTVIRTVGQPVEGRCTLSANRVVLMAH
jgi:hypothetical protein